MQEIPEVDGVLGTASYDEILAALDHIFAGESFLKFKDIDTLPKNSKKRVVTTGGYFEYLKIAEGCDKHCTYCIIPKLRDVYKRQSTGSILRMCFCM